ncbi:glycosyltransferase family 2 protein [Vibrio genomosp. F6]|uniref:Glycosyl transferase n=1 Tax=Vibrio genomosp. F6 str. FF-238 TaxID=1191298 RepID=A0A1E5CLG6_9VIBR|nr:glycosyltransferase family 2 protein [Vibrio genomosp. F6]OEE69545.1 glycosyl transferase [Vibrio genomosp. F6 str. FF-238]
MTDILLISVFLFSGALIVYHHVGYPMLLKWYSANHPIKQVTEKVRGYRNGKLDRTRSTITILVPAFNEQQWIAEKIRNLASLDYPRDRLKVIIACDGCTDNTAEIAQLTIQEAICSDTYFEVHEHTVNRGKVAVINHEMLSIDSDITALSDVSALISIDALLIADSHFSVANIGVVNATYQIMCAADEGEQSYWNYQNQVKLNEASLGSTLGAHGACYLFRTHLFEALPSNTINDDFVLPMEIVKKGYIADYEPRIVAIEMEATSQNADFKRRLRISAGNMQQAIRLISLFNPRFRGVAFAFFSGKGLRLVTPYLMLACLISSITLANHSLFMAIVAVQVTVYSVGLIGFIFPQVFTKKIFKLITYLLTGHYANLVGGLRYLLGFENGRWNRVNH